MENKAKLGSGREPETVIEHQSHITRIKEGTQL